MGNKVKGVVDIVFLMDASGSMQKCIDRLRDNLGLFIDKLGTVDPNGGGVVKDWRAKVVGYRDYEVDAANWLVDNPFTRDVAGLKAQLSNLTAMGGGDEPESLLDALYAVGSMPAVGIQDPEEASKWRYKRQAARVVIVFTDAPFKPAIAIPEAKGGTVKDIINLIQANRLILSIFAPPRPCYDELGAADKSEFMPTVDQAGNEVSIDVFTQDQNRFQTTLEQLAKSVSQSATVEAL